MKKSETTPEKLDLKDQLLRMNRNLERQNKYYSRGQVIIRSLLTGIFTALGATIGFTLVLFYLASFVNSLSAVPIINDLLDQTGISKIIDYQIQQIDGGNNQNPSNTPDSYPNR
ncbi:MAG: DUF5665 domain-containing protein [Candidatus Dojkabacteria bacterium]|uniref:Uncharacterized protein n=2 Tax=Candidatus Dojkabacteria TaxID=74243 RepID=A0A952ALB1_9BACT|nr:hypothetical protein [Candidatus Dojkabacteria bacterium]WKZ27911.1 MAG: DUF5665 domain-containing protein [Candidatus Dojkabacteria bacterium]